MEYTEYTEEPAIRSNRPYRFRTITAKTTSNTPKRSAGDPRFHALLTKIGELHDLKSQDYGSDYDPYANVRASQDFGVAPWVGALVRLNDKVHRLQEFARKGALANESAEDSMLDVAVYSLIALILYQESSEAVGDPVG